MLDFGPRLIKRGEECFLVPGVELRYVPVGPCFGTYAMSLSEAVYVFPGGAPLRPLTAYRETGGGRGPVRVTAPPARGRAGFAIRVRAAAELPLRSLEAAGWPLDCQNLVSGQNSSETPRRAMKAPPGLYARHHRGRRGRAIGHEASFTASCRTPLRWYRAARYNRLLHARLSPWSRS